MDKIKISSMDGLLSIELPRVKAVMVGASEVSKSVTMASGKVVKDMIGYRASLTAEWDWIPADTIITLVAMLKSGGFFYVEYPSPQGDASGVFEIGYPSMKIFAFKNGVPVWHGVKLPMTAQEVFS